VCGEYCKTRCTKHAWLIDLSACICMYVCQLDITKRSVVLRYVNIIRTFRTSAVALGTSSTFVNSAVTAVSDATTIVSQQTNCRNTHTLCSKKKHVTTFLMISWSRTVCLQRFLAHLLLRVQAVDRCFYFPTSPISCSYFTLGNCQDLNISKN